MAMGGDVTPRAPLDSIGGCAITPQSLGLGVQLSFRGRWCCFGCRAGVISAALRGVGRCLGILVLLAAWTGPIISSGPGSGN